MASHIRLVKGWLATYPKKMTKRAESQKAAEKAYRERHTSVLVRLVPDEVKRLDAARGDRMSRAEYLKAHGLPAPPRRRA